MIPRQIENFSFPHPCRISHEVNWLQVGGGVGLQRLELFDREDFIPHVQFFLLSDRLDWVEA